MQALISLFISMALSTYCLAQSQFRCCYIQLSLTPTIALVDKFSVVDENNNGDYFYQSRFSPEAGVYLGGVLKNQRWSWQLGMNYRERTSIMGTSLTTPRYLNSIDNWQKWESNFVLQQQFLAIKLSATFQLNEVFGISTAWEVNDVLPQQRGWEKNDQVLTFRSVDIDEENEYINPGQYIYGVSQSNIVQPEGGTHSRIHLDFHYRLGKKWLINAGVRTRIKGRSVPLITSLFDPAFTGTFRDPSRFGGQTPEELLSPVRIEVYSRLLAFHLAISYRLGFGRIRN